jgi:hypothetical protein
MKTKVLLLLISCLLMTTGLYAQTERFRLYDEEEIASDTTKVVELDTAQQVKEIPVTFRTWDNLEQTLKDEVIRLSKNYTSKKVAKSEIVWIYQIQEIPTSSGPNTYYLSMLARGGFILSNNDPNRLEEVCECYLNLQQPERVITSSRHQTDDEVFGTPVSTGKSRKLKVVEF